MKQELLFGGPVYTGIKDELQNGLAVLIEDDKIAVIEQEAVLLEAYPESKKRDLGGKTLMPGLVDTHRHLIGYTDLHPTTDLIVTGAVEGVRVAHDTLRSGITTIRDPGCKHMGVFTLKRLIKEGFIPGPHIYAAGPNPTGTAAPEGWRNMWVDGDTEIRHAVRELKRQGVDWIKFVVSSQSRRDLWRRTDKFLTFEELKAGVDEAHQYGYRVSGHVEGLDGAQMAVEAGFSAIEHGTVIDDALANKMAELGVFYVPTLFAFDTMSDQEDPLMNYEEEPFNARAAEHKRSFQRALEAGVKIAVGTDMYRLPPLDSYVNELRMLTHYGMSNAQVLHAATYNGAAILGLENEFGTIAPGMRADLIVIDGNPINDLASLLNIELVIKNGTEMTL
ncbi:MAG TPA: amidohydrolase family protein [Anaerolineales bacterium]|nr:amidohydrolase family protein [Anaerolineales bacterium]